MSNSLTFGSVTTPAINGCTCYDKAPTIPTYRDANVHLSSCALYMTEKCPDGLLPDGPICPRCGGNRGPSGVNGKRRVNAMTKQQKVTHDAQELVRKILTNQFGQKPSQKQIREVAKKVSATIPWRRTS